MTETYRDATYISTDSHVTEPIELYAERVDAEYRDRVPRIETVGDGARCSIEGLDPRKLMPASEREVAVVGDFDADDRLRDQARDGVSAEVIFPTFALQACFSSRRRRAPAQLCRAYNGWAADVFDDPRLLPVGVVSMLDIDAAIDEAKRVAEQGFRALFLPAQVPQRPYNDAAYDRFWAVAEELGLPLTFHSGTGYEPRVVRGPGGAVINYLMGAQLDGPMVILTLAAGGALDRFPELRVVTVETGASWLAWIMTQADSIYEDHNMCARPKLSIKPSELIRRQCAATFMYDPVAINNRAITGVETLMWGNDYPHPEGTWPTSQDVAADQFDGVSDDDVAGDRVRQRGEGVRLRPRQPGAAGAGMTNTTDATRALFTPAAADDPHPVYRRLRQECPVARRDGEPRGEVYLNRYEDIFWAMRHPEYFTSDDMDLYLGEQPQIPLEVDPPRHTAVPAAAQPAVRPPRDREARARSAGARAASSSTASPVAGRATSTRSSPRPCRRASSSRSWACPARTCPSS